jgi:hypothetical protein
MNKEFRISKLKTLENNIESPSPAKEWAGKTGRMEGPFPSSRQFSVLHPNPLRLFIIEDSDIRSACRRKG